MRASSTDTMNAQFMQHDLRDVQGGPTPPRSSPEPQTTGNGTDTQVASTSGQQTRPGATPTQETPATNNRQTRPLDTEEDVQQRPDHPTILIPPFHSAKGPNKKHRRKY